MTPLAIGDLILVEVLQGFRQEKDVATARQLFRSLAVLWGYPDSVDRCQGSTGVSVRVLMSCCS